MLLEVETDKAQMDVEAQEDGVMAKILVSGVYSSPEDTQARIPSGKKDADIG